METIVPDKKDPAVRAFCRRVVRSKRPQYVYTAPLAGEPFNECFSVVPKHVAAHGGEARLGWAIWITPQVFIEAEFHAVWKRPDGGLVDVVPREEPERRILFLADPGRQYEGVRIDNIRRALRDDWRIHRYLELCAAVSQELNQCDSAENAPGQVVPSSRALTLINEMEQMKAAIMNAT